MFSFFQKVRSHQITIAGQSESVDASPKNTLLETLLGTGLTMPHDCKVGSCGTCRFRLLDGKIKELSPSALALDRDALVAGYRLACQAMPRSDLEIAVDAELKWQQPMQEFRAKIIATPRLCPDIIGLVLELDRSISFTPGQHADLSVSSVEGPRTYSFAFAPVYAAVSKVHFHVRHVPGGAFTDWLFGGDRVGQELNLTGPDGEFYLKVRDKPILCIAGGSGLAPILSILQSAQLYGSPRPVTLLYGARTQAHLYCLEEIEKLRQEWPTPFTFVPVLSEEDPASSWTGARGLVTDQIASLKELAGHDVYLCGPPPMIDAAEAVLIEADVPQDAISADRFHDRSAPTKSSG